MSLIKADMNGIFLNTIRMKVKNLEHLKKLSTNDNDDFEDFYIRIANGLARSSKRVLYLPEEDEFSIIHEVDESYIVCSFIELVIKTNFMEAIYKGNLHKYSD